MKTPSSEDHTPSAPLHPVLSVNDQISRILELHGLTHWAVLDPVVYETEPNPGPPLKSFAQRWRQHVAQFKQWIAERRHGSMTYLERNIPLRADPRLLMPGVSSVFVFLIPYDTGHRVRSRSNRNDPNTTPADAGNKNDGSANGATRAELQTSADRSLLSRIARYARHRDYHKIIKRRLSHAFEDVRMSLPHQHSGTATIRDALEYRVIVDSVPFLDRAHANLAGLGFIGKNTMLIRPGLGSYFFIASVLTNLKGQQLVQESQQPKKLFNRLAELNCGSCNRCVEACPTQAITGDYTLDATRCFSYWSIESRETTPNEFLGAYRDLFFGCDICQEVCPYNFVTNDTRRWTDFEKADHRLRHADLTLRSLSTLSTSDYEKFFGGFPLTRAKREGLIRNALYGLLENGDMEGLRLAEQHWRHQPNSPELVEQVLRQISKKARSDLKSDKFDAPATAECEKKGP